MQFSIARKFMLQPVRRYYLKRTEQQHTHNFRFDTSCGIRNKFFKDDIALVSKFLYSFF